MSKLSDWSIEEEIPTSIDLIYSINPTKREKQRLDCLRKKFVWVDSYDQKHKLSSICDMYLQNIINFLQRKLIEIPPVEDMYLGDDWWTMTDNQDLIDEYEHVIDFLEWEQKQRKKVLDEPSLKNSPALTIRSGRTSQINKGG